MKPHPIGFYCDNGHKGTILEVACGADGTLSLYGICVMCGTDIERTFSMAGLIGACAIRDCQDEREEDPAVKLLRNFVATGRIN